MQKLFEKIASLYGIPLPEKADKITAGYLSENHILAVGPDRFFLKKYRSDDSARIREIHSVKSFFSQGGIPVIMPLPTKDGPTFFVHESAHYALFPFVSGRQFERRQLTLKAAASLGQMLGRMHLLGAKSVLKAKIAFKPWDSAASLKQIDLLLTKAYGVRSPDDFDATAIEILRAKKTFIENNPVPCNPASFPNDHLLHGDYHDANVFFNEHDEVTHVFDFDESGYGPRTDEIFRALKYSLICGDKPDEILANAKAYMDTYRRVYPISSDEIVAGLQALQIKTAHGLWVESEHYLSGNSRTDSLLPFELARLKFLSVHLEDMISSLTS